MVAHDSTGMIIIVKEKYGGITYWIGEILWEYSDKFILTCKDKYPCVFLKGNTTYIRILEDAWK